MLKEATKKIQDKIVRIIVDQGNNQSSSGTGFLIGPNSVLTCSHVAFGCKDRKSEEEIVKLNNNLEKTRALFNERVEGVALFKENGDKIGVAILSKFDIGSDSVIFSFDGNPQEAVDYDVSYQLEPGEKVAFCGFPKLTNSTNPLSYSFMLNEGIISGFPKNAVGGFPEYEHIQINAVSVGGFSGSPIFLEEGGTVIGFINGSSNRSFKTTLIQNSVKGRPTLTEKHVSIPIGVTYGTKLSQVSELLK